MDLTLWHNPRCSKSRAALNLMEERGVRFDLRLYLQDPPDAAELQQVHGMLGRPVIDMVRTGETAFKDAGLTAEADDDALFDALAGDPILIERPILIAGERAAIGRPADALLALL